MVACLIALMRFCSAHQSSSSIGEPLSHDSLLAFLVLIGVLITVHEFGHYIVAKAFGVKVEAFSVGFGSPIVQFHWGETEYKLCWIPLGGYVRMLGQLDYELEDGEKKEVDSADIGRSINEQTPLIRILIYLAGPAMNLILPFFILTPFIALSDNYRMVPDNTIGAVDSSMPAGKAGLEPGDQIVEINEIPVELFWQIREEISKYDDTQGPLRLKVKRSVSGQVDAVDVQPHPLKITHPFLGYEITRYQIGYQPAFLDASLGFLKTDNPLYAVGLRTGDRIASVNDVKIDNMVMFRRAIETLRAGDLAVIEALRTGPKIDTRFPFMREQNRVKIQLKVQAPFTLESAGVVHASICVEGIRKDGPASHFLQPGDCIVAVDGQRHSLGGYIERALRTHPDQPKQISYIRDGKEFNAELKPEGYILKDAMAGDVPLHSKGFTLPQQTFLPPKMVPAKSRWAHGWYESITRIPKEIEDTLRTIGMVSGG